MNMLRFSQRLGSDGMGKFDFNFDQELTRQLERLENYDEIAPRILNGAVVILQKRVMSECANHVQTADLLNSIKKTTADKNKYGWYVCVRPTGVDGKGVRNMEKLVYAEYGTSKQSPTPILTKATKDSESEVADRMQEIFNEVVGG